MPDKLIFLSHIHEESVLAKLFKDKLEAEFSGFVGVFVSSDDLSIPAGSNFLKGIENALASCVGAIYLISPLSVNRNWINFELGAMWVRNILSIREGKAEIPTLPIFHSGIAITNLPVPLNNLNGITANQASQLEFAFRSIQRAVGGNGALRTDFTALAAEVIAFEQRYTLGSNLVRFFSLLDGDRRKLVQKCEELPHDFTLQVDCRLIETKVIEALKEFEANELKGHIKVSTNSPGTVFGSDAAGEMAVDVANVKIDIPVSLVLKFKDQLLEAYGTASTA